ncbi:MAG: hypothetical protein DRN20_04660 [Thermoplasmata archaeon]|nr:MAG: hypothetical protein DRN20_04660 [Thermoplasmata archaeon]
MSMIVRKAKRDDNLDFLSNPHEKDLFSEHAGRGEAIVACLDDRIAGVLCYDVVDDKVEVIMLRIRPELYGQGIASLLLNELRGIAKGLGAKIMTFRKGMR